MAALFGGAASSLSAPSVGAQSPNGQGVTAGAVPAPLATAEVNPNALIAEGAKDLADYQRLTAEGKLGEAGQKLEELKRILDKLNARR